MPNIKVIRQTIPSRGLKQIFQRGPRRPGRSAFSFLSNLGPLIKSRMRFVLGFVFAAVFVFSAAMLIAYYAQGAKEENAFRSLAALTSYSPAPSASASAAVPQTSPVLPAEPVMLSQYQKLHERNTDMAGWIKIEGTGIDYPVMHTSDDFYLSHGFDKEKSKSGVPYIDKRCATEPFGTNTIVYGHHMKNGTMFAGLLNYRDENFFKEHPIIRFDSLYERREYEIIAVFESQIYRKRDTVFKHYNFLNAADKADFDDYIANIKELSLYDTGTDAGFGDELLTLVTCAYHTEDGQFVVVARKTHTSSN